MQDIYYFKKAFPYSDRPLLKRVYRVVLDEDTPIKPFQDRPEIEWFGVAVAPQLASVDYESDGFPEDYFEYEGQPNTALELIRAPQAWQITHGDPNTVIGMSDSFIREHEELEGKIADTIVLNNSIYSNPHGTAVASIMVAATNNSKGIAGVAYDSKLTVVKGNDPDEDYKPLHEQLNALIHYPGMRVVNCSWYLCPNVEPRIFSYLEKTIKEADSLDVLIVAAAGNGQKQNSDGSWSNRNSCDNIGNGYAYPASFDYDNVISVTSIGHLFPIGSQDSYYYHSLIDDTLHYAKTAWKDVFMNDVYTDDVRKTVHSHNDKVDITAPGYHVTMAINDSEHPSGYKVGSGTSQAAPFVTGGAALMFAVNPNLTAAQAKQILLETADDIYHIPYNENFTGELGTGRLNLYRAVLTAKCMANNNPSGVDLMIRNDKDDFGIEPYTGSTHVWESPDIWVRNNPIDGTYIDVNENPEYDANALSYVYVRVTNNGCQTSSGNDQLKLYWAKAATSLHWPDYWDGSIALDNDGNIVSSGTPMGGEIMTKNIPPLGPGEETIVKFPWEVPNPSDYENFNSNPWHFCLLGRIESDDDPMTVPEQDFITDNVINNNNIGWKNVTVVDNYPNTPGNIGGVIAVTNPFLQKEMFDLILSVEDKPGKKDLNEIAEIGVELDETLYQNWVNGGSKKSNTIEVQKDPHKLIIKGKEAQLKNLAFNPTELGTLNMSFNFLTREGTADNEEYTFRIGQVVSSSGKLMGGETYQIKRHPRPLFYADAGNNREVETGETVVLEATDINESSVYNWYDPEGNLIQTGKEITLNPEISKKYKLEVIADSDGYKDYSEVEVNINSPFKLEKIYPNPASSSTTVEYKAEQASSAYLSITSISGGTSDNYILDPQEDHIALDLAAYSTGIYVVSLFCDGELEATQELVIQ